MASNAIIELKKVEALLLEQQKLNPNRNAAVAITHLQTAILWLSKEFLDGVIGIGTQEEN